MIPKILHYCFGMSPDFGKKPWSQVHRMCFESAVKHIEPEKVIFWLGHEPEGPQWEPVRSHPLVSLKFVDPPTTICGRPINHTAHRADLIRIRALQEYGGIYLDADVLVAKSFDPLLVNRCVLGKQGRNCICNAVMMSEPNHPFFDAWLDEYTWFDDAKWAYHSVRVPYIVYGRCGDGVTLLPEDQFFAPPWQRWEQIFTRPLTHDPYAIHLWEQLSWNYCLAMNEQEIETGHHMFSVLARRALGLAEPPPPSVSVVLLTWNNGAEAVRCFKSLEWLLDRPEVIEWIIVDNGSTPDELAPIAEWAQARHKVTLVRNETNLGIAAGRNAGFERASGDFILSLDSDVFCESTQWYERLYSMLTADTSLGVCGVHGSWIDKHWRIQSLPKQHDGPADDVTGFCQFFRRELVDLGCRYDESLGLYWHSDTDFTLQARYLGYHAAVIPRAGLAHTWGKRTSGDQSSARWPQVVAKWKDLIPVGE